MRCVGRLYECLALSSKGREEKPDQKAVPTESGRDPGHFLAIETVLRQM